MKYTIEGFSQKYATALKDEKQRIDCTDLVILRWFVDFKDSGKMSFIDVGNQRFYWVQYNKILDDLPLISMTKRALYDRMQKMVKFGLLSHYNLKNGGNYSCYGIGQNYVNLLCDTDEVDCIPFGSQLHTLEKSTSEPFGSQLPNKDNSIKDSSIKYSSTKNSSLEKKQKIEKRKYTKKPFVPPTLQEVEEYCRERNSCVDPKRFYDYFSTPDNEGRTWIDSKGNPVRNWKQKIIVWEGSNQNGAQAKTVKQEERDYSYVGDSLVWDN